MTCLYLIRNDIFFRGMNSGLCNVVGDAYFSFARSEGPIFGQIGFFNKIWENVSKKLNY